jgi:hypothetical protein
MGGGALLMAKGHSVERRPSCEAARCSAIQRGLTAPRASRSFDFRRHRIRSMITAPIAIVVPLSSTL